MGLGKYNVFSLYLLGHEQLHYPKTCFFMNYLYQYFTVLFIFFTILFKYVLEKIKFILVITAKSDPATFMLIMELLILSMSHCSSMSAALMLSDAWRFVKT